MKNFFKTEWSKLRQMTFGEKRQYIWEYYKLQIFIFIFVAFVVGNLINVIFISPRKFEYLYIAWLGIPADEAALEGISQELGVIVENPARQVVAITDYTETGNFSVDRHLRTRFRAMLQTGALDLFFTTDVGITELAEEGFIQSTERLMQNIYTHNPELYTLLSERLLYVQFERGDELRSNYMAISLHGFWPEFGTIYAAVVGNTTRFNEIRRALEVIIDGS